MVKKPLSGYRSLGKRGLRVNQEGLKASFIFQYCNYCVDTIPLPGSKLPEATLLAGIARFPASIDMTPMFPVFAGRKHLLDRLLLTWIYIDSLNETGAGGKYILIFSDLKEELAKGYVRNFSIQMGGFNVVALNVTKLRSDNIDPREYMSRLEYWKRRSEEGNARWRVINDLERLDAILAD